MGTDVSIERERLTERERQTLEHLEQAQNLGVALTEYASAYNLDVRDLYAGKASLVKKGILPRSVPIDKADFIPVRIAPKSSAVAFRLTHPAGWKIECASLPEASWVLGVMHRADDPA